MRGACWLWGVRRGRDFRQAVIDKSGERVVFFSGNVLLEDGTPPPETVRIERVCAGRTSPNLDGREGALWV